MWTTFTDTIKSMYDALVRTYTPMIVGAILGFIATYLPIVPDEVEQGVVILISLFFQLAWFFIGKLVEASKGRASKLLTLGLTKAQPVYGEVIAKPTEDVVVVDTTEASG